MPKKISPSPQLDPAAEKRRRRNALIVTLVAGLTVLVPFLFWKQTWFGEPLTEVQINEYLADGEKPRHIQQALVQIQERIERGDASAQRWYPQMAALKDSPVVELRVTLAWVLGSDNQSDLFHQTLIAMLADHELLVRRNAALSLVRFNDAIGRDEILKTLEVFTIRAPAAGVVHYRLPDGVSVDPGTILARLEIPDASPLDIHSSLPGRILSRVAPEGAEVVASSELVTLAPAEDHVWEALRAMLLIGREEDLPAVERFVQSSEKEYSARIRDQAALTAAEIRKRAAVASSSEPRP